MKTRNATNTANFLIPKKNIKSISDTIKPTQYYVSNGYTGKGVKIAIIDSGCPKHNDIPVEGEKISFCDDNLSVWDKCGHSTMVSGIIVSNNKNSIMGIAPDANLMYGKVINDTGQCSYNSMVAAVLWAVVKQVDIIVMALGSQYDYSVLHDAIIKAKKADICIFAAAGEDIKNEYGEVYFPARYPEVFSTGFLTRGKIKNIAIKERVDFYAPNKGLITTYLDNQYVKAYGSSVATAYFAGLSAVLIEKYRKTIPKYEIPSLIYSKLIKSLL